MVTKDEKKIVVVEANEIPLRIFRRYAERYPNSTIARLLKDSLVTETMATDVSEASLYPSQTWASLNTGVPYEKHRIYFYNDNKAADYPFYWEIVANQGYSVGLVSSLHSSPAKRYAQSPGIKFLIPDCFAEDDQTKPHLFEVFQRVNLKHTDANKRVASSKVGVGLDEVKLLLASPSLGLCPKTILAVSALLGKILVKRANRERVRVIQFMFAKDIFMKNLKSHDVQLGIFFTNHVAANMHRYWYALFPEDYETSPFDLHWIERYKDEIFYSVEVLDEFLGELRRFCDETHRVLVVVTSMGQCANPSLDKGQGQDIVVESLPILLRRLGIDDTKCDILSAMVPEYTLRFQDSGTATSALSRFVSCQSDRLHFSPTLRDTVLTIHLSADATCDSYDIEGSTLSLSDLGFRKVVVDDGHAGQHHPRGSLIIYGSKTAEKRSELIDYLEYAPAMCGYFNIARRDYMQTPTLAF